MIALLDMIRAWWRNTRDEIALADVTQRYREQGHPVPTAAAMEEIQMRGYLEQFRDFASSEYLLEPRPLDDIKEKWIAEHLKPASKGMGIQNAGMLRKIIRDMPAAEMFHPPVYERWRADSDCGLARHRRKPLSALLRPHERRVLRCG